PTTPIYTLSLHDALPILVFTDPPYNVDYEGYTADKLTIQNDRMMPEEFDQFLRGSFASYRAVVKPGASLYVCHASSVQREFQNTDRKSTRLNSSHVSISY